MLSLREIISNIKKGQSALNVRHILNGLEVGYQKIQPNITIAGSKKMGTNTIIFLTIPSETTKKVSYDIVVWIASQDKMNLDTNFKVYSNSPSFAYNFAYVFYKNGSLLFPEKYPKSFKEMTPKTRNPFMTTGFDKHVFASIRYISDYGLKRIVGESEGHVPQVKSFTHKVQQIGDIKAELKKSSIV